MDRLDELNVLDKIADVISYYTTDGETAESLVLFYESGEIMPDWYDEYDRKILIEKVQALCFD
jgi:hypothetical protein